MKVEKNIVISGADELPIGIDIFYEENEIPKPVIVYAHGFAGFKDWGNFDLIAREFAERNFVFVKFNFSHNGTTPETPEEFTNLETFGNNNYTKQLTDIDKVINWVVNPDSKYANEINEDAIFLLGHSMGGGIVLIKASEDKRIKKVATWASISQCKTPWGNWDAEKIMDWEKTGKATYKNGRTQQDMPLYYQLHNDYEANKERLNIEAAISNLIIPVLLCHGSADEAVPLEKAFELKEAQPNAELFVVNSDHVFGRKHPWEKDKLPGEMDEVLQETINFFNQPISKN